jgi:hypothetical protein
MVMLTNFIIFSLEIILEYGQAIFNTGLFLD